MRRCIYIAIVLVMLCSSVAVNPVTSQEVLADSEIQSDQGIEQVIIDSKPPEILVASESLPDSASVEGINYISGVPAFDWSYGCSATAAAMLFGYYDRTGDYNNMYTGPTNGGICPLNNSVWGHTSYPIVTCGECPLSATHQGYDGLTERGHVDDYWIDYGNAGPDPYLTGGWTEHTSGDCTADFMGTNQSKFGNSDGGTVFYYYSSGTRLYNYDASPYRDGCYGLRLFAESRGYSVHTNYTQLIKGVGSNPSLGFTLDDFKAEIDAGRPVMIWVKGHSMLGFGYSTVDSKIYIHDTWDYNTHSMVWGGTYAGMQHLGVHVIQLDPPTTSVITSTDASGNEKNSFLPGEDVYVKGTGLKPNTEYVVWIQEDAVVDGDTLVTGEDPSGSQEPVTTDGSGDFGPTLIWSIPSSASFAHTEWDIVVDKQDDGVNTGKYNAASDGIDSASTEGFVAPVPELPAVILLGVGLLGIAGYLGFRRSRNKQVQTN